MGLMVYFRMLFNSYQFIFVFLLPLLVVYRYVGVHYRLWFLVAASVLFYGQWSVVHLGVLLVSIGVNFALVGLMLRLSGRKFVLFCVILFNLGLLGYFKYSGLLFAGGGSVVLPLAISFFTFQQIAYGVDVYKMRVVEHNLSNYLFFVLFFPQLVAGPIVHYNQLIAQIGQLELVRTKDHFWAQGLILFSLGLFKKVAIADTLGGISDPFFDKGAIDGSLSTLEAWVGMFAYGLQIYFDFSGYSDMALGLALFFGIVLPINFYSPYKAVSVVEFWRRWHITLSNFLRDHVYIPLGGSRASKYKEGFNLLVTMGLGGLWHGAGWSFVVWGLGHGVLLMVAHLWRRMGLVRVPPFVAIGVTFLAVNLLWVLFRAQDIGVALSYYGVMFDFGSFGSFEFDRLWWLVVGGLAIVWLLPNSIEFSNYGERKIRHLYAKLFFAALSFFVSLQMMASAPSQEFVYFNF